MGDDGFLYDPEAEYGPQINPNAVPFSDLHAKNCLVLLGEPGIGKSIAIQREVATCRNSFAASDELISIDLGEYGDESRVIEDVFKAPAVANWATGSHLLHLFLDSLDECGLQVAHVAKILRNELAKLKPHLSRLRLRIVCRTADWPASLTTALNDLWNETPEVYELLPLRRRDIASAASEKECDADEFVDELIRVGAQSLAIKPVTLEFLISAYKSDHGFPSRQAELYSRGCHLLCEETNQGRRDAKQVGRLTSQRRFVVAQRIAAALILGNKSSIRLGLSVHEQSPTSLDVADLIGGVEILNWERFEVGAPEIEEALRTGLFSGRGQGRVGFAHHTYAEFLTAGYLASRVRRLSDRMNLLRNADDTEGKIVPQLAETAAWLAGMDAKAFDEIMLCDPQILVRSDVAKADASDRKLLIQRLLDLFAADEIREAGWEEHLHYHKLNHEGLSAQLTTVICDRSKGLSVRRFAISVAQDCARRDLQSLLADRALDTTEGYAVRVRAAYAVVAIGDGASQLRLKPLALETSPGDEDFTLKALVLRTLWPKYITAEELFQNLTVPEQGTYGTYRHFLNYELPDQLTAAQVPQALRWVITLSDAELQEHSIRPLIEKMSRLAWTHLDDPDVRAAMAAFAIVRLRGHDDIVPMDTDGVDDQPGHRRMLVETIVREMGDLGSHLTGLIYLPPRLLGRSDTLWLLTKITEERDDDKIEHWVGLIEHLFNPMTPGHLDAALRVCEKIPKLDAALRPQYQAIALDSEEAKRLRKQYEHFEELRRRVDEGRNPPPLDPPPDIRIQQHLSAS
ncbi:MAG TPA: hypothetical protein VFG04_24305, partial [Planctomycetaceae bacterium]|nr:hypothetical protein [Planctomycetaceae bacterium]